MNSRVVITVLALVASGCGPRMPDEARARAMYQSLSPRVDSLRSSLRTSLHWLAEMDPFANCAPADAVCEARRDADRARFFELSQRFSSSNLSALLAGGPVLGLRVEVHFRDGSRHVIGNAEPFPPGEANGSVSPERGVDSPSAEEGRMGPRRDNERLGWGLYQTAYRDSAGRQRGDGAFHPGIEVTWREYFGLGSNATPAVTIDVRVVMLGDGFVRPANW